MARRRDRVNGIAIGGSVAVGLVVLTAGLAVAADPPLAGGDDIRQLRDDVQALQTVVSQQRETLRRQQAALQTLQGARGVGTELAGPPKAVPASFSTGHAAIPLSLPYVAPTQATQEPEIVGEAPKQKPVRPVPVLPEKTGVLTRAGGFVVEPSIEYQHTDVHQFAVGGAAIADTVLIGSFEASQAKRTAVTAALSGRYGLTDRLELELKVPYVYRSDQVTNTILNSNTTAAKTDITSHNLGDVEGSVHYQLNATRGDWPVLVGNLRVKSTTGTSPYDVSRDSQGIEQELATGSGFWGVEPSITAIVPSDPVVFYGNLGYLWNVPDTFDKQIGQQTVKKVEPGDAIRLSLGMGLGLNEKTSFTLGWQQDWITGAKTTFATSTFKAEDLNVGSIVTGVNYQVDESFAINFSVAAGITADAPNMRVMLRTPYSF